MLDGDLAKRLIGAAQRRVSAHRNELSRLDAMAGDGDHGVNMAAALSEATKRIEASQKTTAAEVFRATGRAFHDTVGGAAGALFGSFFGAVAGQLSSPIDPPSTSQFVSGLEKGLARVTRLGRVKPGDKTMVDALGPAVANALTVLGKEKSLAEVLSAAAQAARQGAASTAVMRPQAGRARYAAQQSMGAEDPGACTVALIFEAWSDVSNGKT